MHYFAAVVIPRGVSYEDVEPYVAKVMAPHQETYDEAAETLHGLWDWWQIGGRWTGVWAEYDPHKDPRNIEGPEGPFPGEVKWPTQWAPLADDLIPVALFLRSAPELMRRPITIVTPTRAIERETWDGESFHKKSDEEWEAILQDVLSPHAAASLLVVDYHS